MVSQIKCVQSTLNFTDPPNKNSNFLLPLSLSINDYHILKILKPKPQVILVLLIILYPISSALVNTVNCTLYHFSPPPHGNHRGFGLLFRDYSSPPFTTCFQLPAGNLRLKILNQIPEINY